MAWLKITIFILVFACQFYSLKTESWIKAAHWDSASEIPIADIDSSIFTHLFASFAHINSSTYQLYFKDKNQDFTSFTETVQTKNPSITTLLSIWGKRNESLIFNAMLANFSYRKSFISSSIKIARLYGFSGLCLSGVDPNNFTNMANFDVFLDEWRAAVDSEAKASSRSSLLLTIMGYYVPENGSVSYPVKSLYKNLDWIVLMTFDYYIPVIDNSTQFHAALYNPLGKVSTNYSVSQWINKGLPPSKLLLGLPFHGWVWTLADPKHDAVGSLATGPGITLDGSMGYKFIKSYLRGYGYGANAKYSAGYVMSYCTVGSIWFNFDDVESIKAKVSYAKNMGLRGYHMFQLSNDDNWTLSRAAGEGRHKKNLLLFVLIPLAGGIILLAALVCYLKATRRLFRKVLFKLKNKGLSGENQSRDSSDLHVYSYSQIRKATNNFSIKNKLGEGGYGPVYRGKLSNGQDIAVKRLSKTSSQGLEEFMNEVRLTAKLQHVNLLTVIGVCTEREEKMLIYEYMPNKSLDLYLLDPESRYILDWEKRVHIIDGVIQGLLYLQEYSNFTIIHRDLKSSNIVLDSNMIPKISDFGMARLFRKDEHEANTGRIVGTYGYVPPEYVRNGIYSMKYDVFSFGVLLLQIISGKSTTGFYGPYENLTLLDYAYKLWLDGEGREFIDPSLNDSSSSCKLERCLQVALLCVQEYPVDRPTMLEVYSMLKSETAPVGNPKNPAFSVKKGEGSTSTSNQSFCSLNNVTTSQVIPR